MSMDKGVNVNIDDYNIYYEKIGCGDTKLLLIPGALNTCEIEYYNQLSVFDTNKLTLILIDSPGFGRSRPPDKPLRDWHKNDAQLILKLMLKLKINKFSVLGINDGGRIAIWLTSMFPDYVDKLIICSCNAYFTNNDKNKMFAVRDTRNWPYLKKEKYKKIYQDNLQLIWSNYINSVVNTFIPKNVLSNIQAQTLILNGDEDPMSPKEHATFIKNNIKHSRIYLFKNLSQNFHQENPKEFVTQVEDFLFNNTNNNDSNNNNISEEN